VNRLRHRVQHALQRRRDKAALAALDAATWPSTAGMPSLLGVLSSIEADNLWRAS
jgi:hypothetical protein